jgi:arylsulfatase
VIGTYKDEKLKVLAVTYVAALGLALPLFAPHTATAQDKPNILVIWGDDIGWSNISAYDRLRWQPGRSLL